MRGALVEQEFVIRVLCNKFKILRIEKRNVAIIRNVNEKTLDKKSKFWYYFLVHIGSSYFSVIVYLKSKKYKKVIDKYKIF